jgi:hypothetical protein
LDWTNAAAVCYGFAGQQFAKDDAIELRGHAGTRVERRECVKKKSKKKCTRKEVQIQSQKGIRREYNGGLALVVWMLLLLLSTWNCHIQKVFGFSRNCGQPKHPRTNPTRRRRHI